MRRLRAICTQDVSFERRLRAIASNVKLLQKPHGAGKHTLTMLICHMDHVLVTAIWLLPIELSRTCYTRIPKAIDHM
jgi:ABC-type ATPase involved in cell division